MQKFHGTITNQNPIAKVPKIWEEHILTGEYDGKDGHKYSTKISLWVPHPRQGNHKPGIFLRIANPNGFSYTRLTGDEFADLYTFFRTNFSAATEAYAEAESALARYKVLERTLWIKDQPTAAELEPPEEIG